MMNYSEILAPAGSMESLTAAVNCGANAVYIGGKNFSARQNALNFDNEELKQAADFCHLHNVKLYITVNTVIHDSQAEKFAEFIKTAAGIGADAFIVQDPGAVEIIKNIVPDANIHGSTQMSVHTVNGALFLKEKGFKRVVLSRELSESEIMKICNLGIETEIFVHGALCMSVSGQCYLSSLIGQRSANRGLCAQPCRLPCSAVKNPDANALSLKDLSLIQHLIKMKLLGVNSFKIEGRMKRPEYVASAVNACVQTLDGEMPDMSLLKAVFSRSGFTDGYFTGKREDMFGSREKEDVTAAVKVLPEIRKLYTKAIKTGTIHFHAVIMRDKPAVLEAKCDGEKAVVTGNIPEQAIKKPLDADYLERQLSKLGNTIYDFGGLTAKIDDGITLSAKDINALRREAVEKLDMLKIRKNTTKYQTKPLDITLKNTPEKLNQIRARISDLSQLEAAGNADYIIIPHDLILKSSIGDFSKIIVEPPRFIYNEEEICRELEECRKKGAEHLMCNNIAYIKTGKDIGFRLHGDFGLNIINSYSIKFLERNNFEDAVISFEAKLSQINKMKKNIPTGIIAYGYLPVMLTRNCPIKNETGCQRCKKVIFDRTNRESKVMCHKNYIEILNPEMLYMADRLDDIKNVSFITLYFTNETADEVSSVMSRYTSHAQPYNNITRGLYYRGIL